MKNQTGYTVTEVIMVVLVIAILAAIAIPAFAVWAPDQRLKTAGRKLLSTIQLAKMTAVQRNAYCTVTFNQSISGKTYDCVAFEDTDEDSRYDVGEKIIEQSCFADDYKDVSFDTSQGGGDGIDNTFIDNLDGRPVLSFSSRAFPVAFDGANEVVVSGSIYLVNTRNKTLTVSVSPAGAVNIN
jgi:prepilin-type N-terminal cleavage/methylation domain-containing protein